MPWIDLSSRQGLSRDGLLQDEDLFIGSVYREFRGYLSGLVDVVAEMYPDYDRRGNRLRDWNRGRTTNSFQAFLGSPTNLFVSGRRGSGKTTLVTGLMSDRDFLDENRIEIVGFVDLPSVDHSILQWFMSYLFNIVEEIGEEHLIFRELDLLTLVREVAAALEVIVDSGSSPDVGYWESIQRKIFNVRMYLCRMIAELLNLLKRRVFIIIVDDIDIASVEKIKKFLRETYYFLSCPGLIILGLGDWERLLYKLAYGELRELEGDLTNIGYSNLFLKRMAYNLAEAKIEKVFSYRWVYSIPQKPEDLQVKYFDERTENLRSEDIVDYIHSKLYRNYLYTYAEIRQLIDELSLRKLVQVLERITYSGEQYTLADLYALVSLDVELRFIVLG